MRKYLHKSVFNFYDKTAKVKDVSGHRVGKLIHPLYVELQKSSVLGVKDEFGYTYHMHTASYQESDDVTPGSFYREYVSKSLPLVLKGYCRHWELYEQIQIAIEMDMKNDETKMSRENFEMLMIDMFEVKMHWPKNQLTAKQKIIQDIQKGKKNGDEDEEEEETIETPYTIKVQYKML